jgi:hypothetical protein
MVMLKAISKATRDLRSLTLNQEDIMLLRELADGNGVDLGEKLARREGGHGFRCLENERSWKMDTRCVVRNLNHSITLSGLSVSPDLLNTPKLVCS